jgi:quercetin dioxygenase-like cupin family protein
MKIWRTTQLDVRPRKPEILASMEDARAILIDLPAGESLDDHQVHERAWLVVVAGEIEVTAIATSPNSGVLAGVGALIEFEPSERHRVDAHEHARFLLMLTPWPAPGHPGAMTIEDKAQVRDAAARRR